MVDGAIVVKKLAADEFFRGLLASLVSTGTKRIVAPQTEVHQAFNRLVEMLRAHKFGPELDVELKDVDYDPLYGLSGWLDHTLTWAQRDLLISFGNPSYDLIEIKYDEGQAERVLQGFVDLAGYREVAEAFKTELERAKTYDKQS